MEDNNSKERELLINQSEVRLLKELTDTEDNFKGISLAEFRKKHV